MLRFCDSIAALGQGAETHLGSTNHAANGSHTPKHGSGVRSRSVTVLHNAASGVGGRGHVAATISEALTQAGHTPRVLSLKGEVDHGPIDLNAVVKLSDVLVIAGGDGTVHHSLGALMTGPAPVYHFPLGTENLFSREFASNRTPETLVAAIDRWDVRACDVGVCNGRPFAIMMSIGFDACVVERVAAGRRGGITKAAYVRAGLQELIRPRTPKLTVDVDGRRIVDDRPGMLVIANSRQYAARLDPARDASMYDGQLDVVFYPHATRLGLVRWLLATAVGVHTRMRGLVVAKGREIAIKSNEPFPHQMDGEAAGVAETFSISVAPGAIRVLGAA